MVPALLRIYRAIANAKFKILLALMSVVVFLFMLFPFNDLGDLVATQVAQLTKNQVFLQFEELQMSLFPGPGMKVQKVYVEGPTIPAISAEEIKFAPSISGLIAQQPYGTVDAKGLFGGDVKVQVKSGAKSDNGVSRQRVELIANRLNLQDLRQLGNIPVMMKGKLDLNSVALIDPEFGEQPDVDVSLSIQQFEIPPSMFASEMGDLPIPEIKISRVELKGRLAAGKIIIENGTIGKAGDDLQGTITGNMGLVFEKNAMNPSAAPRPVPGSYVFNLDLKPSRKLQDSASGMLMILESYKVMAADGIHYKLKLSGQNFRDPPSMGALR